MKYLAVKNGEIVHIKDVEKGDKTCHCIACGNLLAVYKGGKKFSDHFQHIGQKCKFNDERDSIFIYAKHLFSLSKGVFIYNIGKENVILHLDEYDIIVVPHDSDGLPVGNLSDVTKVKPDILLKPKKYYNTDEPCVYVYFTYKNNVPTLEIEKFELEGNKNFDVVQIKLYEDKQYSLRDILWGNTDHKTVLYTKRADVDDAPYGVCGTCDVPMELFMNSYADEANNLLGLPSAPIRDSAYEDADKEPRFKMGSLLLRCPKCKVTHSVLCPTCLRRGRIKDMKLIYRKISDTISACCEDFENDNRSKCDTIITLYKGNKIAGEHKKYGGFIKWYKDRLK